MQQHDIGNLAALQALDHPHHPQGPMVIHRRNIKLRDQLAQRAIVARRGAGNVTDMVIDVEIRVVDPYRMVQPERHLEIFPAGEWQHFGQSPQGIAMPLDIPSAGRRRRIKNRNFQRMLNVVDLVGMDHVGIHTIHSAHLGHLVTTRRKFAAIFPVGFRSMRIVLQLTSDLNIYKSA